MSAVPGSIVARLLDRDVVKVLGGRIVLQPRPSHRSPGVHPVSVVVKVINETLPGLVGGVSQVRVSLVPAAFEGVHERRIKVFCSSVHELLHGVQHVHSWAGPINYVEFW